MKIERISVSVFFFVYTILRKEISMKKTLSVLLACTLLAGCTNTNPSSSAVPSSSPTADTGLNAGNIELDATKANMNAYIFMTDDDPAFLEVSTEESLKLFVNGTGMVVYSYETCPWCNRILPVLNDVAKEFGKQVFYVNIYSDSFIAKSAEQKSEIIQSLYQVLDPILGTEKDEETGKEKKVMQVPEVVAVKDGKITAHHLGIVDGFTLDPDKLTEYQVTDSQKEELKNIYREMFKSIE